MASDRTHEAATPQPALIFDLDGTLVDSVYEYPRDLLRHLDEIGVRVHAP